MAEQQAGSDDPQRVAPHHAVRVKPGQGHGSSVVAQDGGDLDQLGGPQPMQFHWKAAVLGQALGRRKVAHQQEVEVVGRFTGPSVFEKGRRRTEKDHGPGPILGQQRGRSSGRDFAQSRQVVSNSARPSGTETAETNS